MSLQDLGSIGELNWRLAGEGELLETEAGARWWRQVAPHLYVDGFRARLEAAMAGERDRCTLPEEDAMP